MGPFFAICTGVCGGLMQEAGHHLMQKARIDDPLDAVAVHGCGGLTGVLMRPLVDKTKVRWHMFGVHCLAIICIAAWSGTLTAMVLVPLKWAGMLVVPTREQRLG